MVEIGLEIERLRREQGWSQVELAQMAGITRMTLRKIEAGKNVSLYIVLQVLAVFGLRLEVSK